jgi:hypothetical protein
MVLAHICRDQDELDECAVWQNFKEGSHSATHIEALIYVPSRILMGVTRSSANCDLPFPVLMKNDLTKFAHSKELYEICVSRRQAPFVHFGENSGKVVTASINGTFCK